MIYTSKASLYAWTLLIVAVGMSWLAYRGIVLGDGNRLGLGVGGGVVFLMLALKRFWDLRAASLETQRPATAPDRDAR